MVFLELVPGWALFRGLYEMSQYAFRASYQVSGWCGRWCGGGW